MLVWFNIAKRLITGKYVQIAVLSDASFGSFRWHSVVRKYCRKYGAFFIQKCALFDMILKKENRIVECKRWIAYDATHSYRDFGDFSLFFCSDSLHCQNDFYFFVAIDISEHQCSLCVFVSSGLSLAGAKMAKFNEQKKL